MNKEVRSTPARVADFHHAKNTLPKKILLHFVIIPINILFGKWKIEEEENMFKITLRAARISCGYTVEEVAEYCGVTTDKLNEFENDCKGMPISIGLKISNLYNLPPSAIFIGSETEYISGHRKIAI